MQAALNRSASVPPTPVPHGRRSARCGTAPDGPSTSTSSFTPPPVVDFHCGLPETARIRSLKQAGCILLSTATGLAEAEAEAEAEAARRAGIDVPVAQGYEAGGHRYPVAYHAGKALDAAARAAGESGHGAQWAGQATSLSRPLPAAELMVILAAELQATSGVAWSGSQAVSRSPDLTAQTKPSA